MNGAQKQKMDKMQCASVLDVPAVLRVPVGAWQSWAREYLHEKGRTVEPRRPEGPQGPQASTRTALGKSRADTHTTFQLLLLQPEFALMAYLHVCT